MVNKLSRQPQLVRKMGRRGEMVLPCPPTATTRPVHPSDLEAV
jgi:hypothetical protein